MPEPLKTDTPAKADAPMDWGKYLALVDAALSFLENAIPNIMDAFKKGQITNEQQQTTLDRINKIRATGGAFTRPVVPE